MSLAEKLQLPVGMGKRVVNTPKGLRRAWSASPEAGQVGADRDRDTRCAAVKVEGIKPLRQVALDAT
jgi:hypothetical protein